VSSSRAILYAGSEAAPGSFASAARQAAAATREQLRQACAAA
jgi:hypothetical protein